MRCDSGSNLNLRAAVCTENQLMQALKNCEIEYVYAPISLPLANLSDDYKKRIIISPPVFIGGDENNVKADLLKLKSAGFNSVLVHTLDTLEIGSELGFILYGGFRLNITNSCAAWMYARLKTADIILSIELSLNRARKLQSPVPKGVVIYGKFPLMLTRRCPINDGKICGKYANGINCGKKLIDRIGNELTVLCDNCAHILNPYPLILSDKTGDFDCFDFHVMLFTDEDNVNDVVCAYKHGKKPNDKFTRGLYYK